MANLDNLTPDSRFMGLFIGRSGVGKKSAVASYPKPILFLDFDGRIRGLTGCSWIDLKGLGDVESFPPRPKVNDLIYQQVNRVLEKIQGEVNIGTCIYKTLYMGSLTGAAFDFLQDGNILSHQGGKGMRLGPLNMTGPGDYRFQNNAAKQTLAFLRFLREHPTGIPNIIVGAHVINRWGKPGTSEDEIEAKVERGETTQGIIEDVKDKFQYDNNIVIGEKLSLTETLAEDVQIYFDHIFKFEKEMKLGNDQPQHFVQFRSEIARTSFQALPNGKVNITGKAFYPGMMKLAGFEVKE
jgi:hypothetical protein